MNKRKIKASTLLAYAFLLILTVFILYPILYVVLGSFKTNQELVLGGARLFPEVFIIDNYIEAWQLANFARYTLNSIFISTMVMLGILLLSSMAGYCFARKDFPLKNVIYGLLIAFMFVNIGSVSLRPLFELTIHFNLHTSLWSVILICIGMSQATNIFLVRGYMNTLPKELDEAAAIDGCSFFGIYYRIILPLLKPVMATIALLSFREAWNEYILPLVFTINDPNKRPLTVGVISLKNVSDGAAAWNIMFAGSTMSIMPIIILFLLTSRYFMSGMTVGAVKG
ncbi:carbohydrate ABC transporter permease [Lachnospiraceae bacterium oral taxon 500]|nr:carbohydrate ABC transporter permease [Lachnospiraceae bacterium oral taxon 500]